MRTIEIKDFKKEMIILDSLIFFDYKIEVVSYAGYIFYNAIDLIGIFNKILDYDGIKPIKNDYFYRRYYSSESKKVHSLEFLKELDVVSRKINILRYREKIKAEAIYYVSEIILIDFARALAIKHISFTNKLLELYYDLYYMIKDYENN